MFEIRINKINLKLNFFYLARNQTNMNKHRPPNVHSSSTSKPAQDTPHEIKKEGIK